METLAVNGASKTPERKPRIEGSLHISSLPERSRPKCTIGSKVRGIFDRCTYMHTHFLPPPPPPPISLSL